MASLGDLSGTGTIRRAGEVVARVNYVVRTVVAGFVSTGQYKPQYSGLVEVLEGIAGEYEWSEAEDLVLHLEDQRMQLPIMLEGESPKYRLRGSGALEADHTPPP